jgi:hypothetical protein
MFQELFNDIKKSSSYGVLTLIIALWKFGGSTGLHLPKWELFWVWGFIPSHFPTFSGACNVTFGLPFWPATLQALCFGREPKPRVATSMLLMTILWAPSATREPIECLSKVLDGTHVACGLGIGRGHDVV